MTNLLTGRQLFDLAPLGAFIRFTDGKPKPPPRFNRKLNEWANNNATGRFYHAVKNDGTPYSADRFSLRTYDSPTVVCNRGFSPDTATQFEILSQPAPGSIIAYSDFQGSPSLSHFWQNANEAKNWATQNRYDLRKYGRKHFIVLDDGTLADWDAATVYQEVVS